MINLIYLNIHYTSPFFILIINILNIVPISNYYHFITNLRICKSMRLNETCGVIRGLKFLVGSDTYYYICHTFNNFNKTCGALRTLRNLRR